MIGGKKRDFHVLRPCGFDCATARERGSGGYASYLLRPKGLHAAERFYSGQERYAYEGDVRFFQGYRYTVL